MFKKKPKTVVDVQPTVTEVKKNTKPLDAIAQTRGFKSYDEAVMYTESDSFKKLGITDQEELLNWIKNIK